MTMICITMFLIGFVVGLGTMALAGAAGYEEGVNDAYKLGYENGRNAEREEAKQQRFDAQRIRIS